MACSVLNYKYHFVNIEINPWKISLRKLRKSFCIIVKLYHLTHTHDCDIRYKEIYLKCAGVIIVNVKYFRVESIRIVF